MSTEFFIPDRPHINLWDLFMTTIPETPVGKMIALRCALALYTLQLENERFDIANFETYILEKLQEAEKHHVIESQVRKEIKLEEEKTARALEREKEFQQQLDIFLEEQKKLQKELENSEDPFIAAAKQVFNQLEKLAEEREKLQAENARLQASTIKVWNASQEKFTDKIIQKMDGQLKNANGKVIALSTTSKDPKVIREIAENRQKLKAALTLSCPIEIMRRNPNLIANLMHQGKKKVPEKVLKQQAAKNIGHRCNAVRELNVLSFQANHGEHDPNESVSKRLLRLIKEAKNTPIGHFIEEAAKELETTTVKTMEKVEEKFSTAEKTMEQTVEKISTSMEHLFEAAVTCGENDKKLKEVTQQISQTRSELEKTLPQDRKDDLRFMR